MTTQAWRTPEKLEQKCFQEYRYWPAQLASGKWTVAVLYLSEYRGERTMELLYPDGLESELDAARVAETACALKSRGWGDALACEVPDLKSWWGVGLAAKLKQLLAAG